MLIIRYPSGAHIPSHTDVSTEGRHYRLNVQIFKKGSGGVFHCEECIYKNKYICFFRPDLFEHSVSKLGAKSCRYVFSVGFILKNNDTLEALNSIKDLIPE